MARTVMLRQSGAARDEDPGTARKTPRATVDVCALGAGHGQAVSTGPRAATTAGAVECGSRSRGSGGRSTRTSVLSTNR